MMRKRSWRRPVRLAGAVVVLGLVCGGLLLADTLTRPLDVHLRAQIEIYQQDEKGDWEKIDEVGPANLRFQATLLQMARDNSVATDFVYRARTKNGRDYSVRLVDQADLSFDPRTGQFDADLVFEVSLDGKSARVEGRLTSETRASPAGERRGKRAEGVLGRSPTTVTLVSANELRLPGERPMLLVCEERYRFIPRGRS